MNRYPHMYPTTQLMTVEEAQRLSTLDAGDEHGAQREQRRRLWSWQTVEGVMSQTISDEQLDAMSARTK